MPAAMPCKTSLCRSSMETCSTVGERKTKHACIVEADESVRIQMEGAPRRYHGDHIAGEGMSSLSRHNLVHKFVPMPQAMKIPEAKAAVEKMGKTRENTVMAIDESQREDCCKIKADDHEPDFNCLDKFLIREPSDRVEKPEDTQSIYRET